MRGHTRGLVELNYCYVKIIVELVNVYINILQVI